MALEFKRNKLNVKDGSGDFVEIPVLGEQKTEKATVGELAIEVSRATAAEEAIAARVDKLQKVVGSPFVAATAASMTNTDRVYVYTGSETGYTAGNWYYYDGTAWVSGGVYNSAGVNVDDTLTYEGMAADAKATGDEISNVKNAISRLGDVAAFKAAILQLAQKVAYIDEHGQNYYDDLYDALYGELVSISAVLAQNAEVYITDDIAVLKQYLTVTAVYAHGSAVVSPDDYSLSGAFTPGASTITVIYGNKTATVSVTPLLWDFTNGYSIGTMTAKYDGTSGNGFKAGYYNLTAARAVGIAPIENESYVFTVTDDTKYQVNAYDIDTLLYQSYYRGNKSIAWADSDSVTTDYVWIELKKNDGTAFTDDELANGAEKVITITGNDFPIIKFDNGYSLGTNVAISGNKMAYRQETSARAVARVPIENNDYVFTVTDSTKYQVAAVDITTLDNGFYHKGNKTIAWAASDSVSTDYVWLALKKLDGTDFTSEELAHGASAVFTYTYSS